MKAIIYAAGRGRVCSGRAENTPRVRRAKSSRLACPPAVREAGVREIVLVTGHLREQIAELLPTIRERHEIAGARNYQRPFPGGKCAELASFSP